VREKARLLAEGAQWVGSPQIRNIATIGGNVVSGQPAADTVIPLLALDAEISVVSRAGARTVPVHDFFTGVGTTVLDSTKEILTEIRFNALGENEAGCYLRIGKRRALTLPLLVCAVVVRLGPDRKRFGEVSIALGPVAPVPYRAVAAESLLKGAPLDEEVLVAAAKKASQDAHPRDSHIRGSSTYRIEMVKVLVKRGLENCLRQLGM
jgi:carbon-monoxide dehydrogenase medium subunit